MRKKTVVSVLLLVFIMEVTVLFLMAVQNTDNAQNAVLVNEAVRSVQADWNEMEHHINQTSLDYVVLDLDENIRFRTSSHLSESINSAVTHRDTILDITNEEGALVGKILIYNESVQILQAWKRKIFMVLSVAMLMQVILCMAYLFYLNRAIVKPFQKLKGFAERVAEGNLDIPLEMDRQNLFGAFTESFDIMRTELKKARQAEAEANAAKKELVAKLSHDIKTPVASIKAASEVGAALTDNERIKDNYTQIILKADQINSLITNLFTATLEELEQLSVAPLDIASTKLQTFLASSDYLHRAKIGEIPSCMIYADGLRLQQVFDNIFANSYKYANTQIEVSVHKEEHYLVVDIEDYGGGVLEEELPVLKEKYRRGLNTEKMEGAGLGLFISDYFMREMQGELLLQNGKQGLKVSVMISLSGTI